MAAPSRTETVSQIPKFVDRFASFDPTLNDGNKVNKVARNVKSAGPKFSNDKSRELAPPPCRPVLVYFF